MSKQKRSHALLLNPGQKLKDSWATATIASNESIISLLALRDKYVTNRELDGSVFHAVGSLRCPLSCCHAVVELFVLQTGHPDNYSHG